MLNFTQRMIGALKLQTAVYEEVEADKGATTQALAVVVLASVATGIGVSRTSSPASLTAGTLAALLGWLIWAGLTSFIGTKILPEPQTKSDIGELLRTTGFASAPVVFNLLVRLPLIGGVGGAVWWLVSVWMFVAMVVAVRQALDYKSTGRAVGVVLIGWLLVQVAAMFLSNLSELH
jgi:Yip1 domain